MWPYKEIIAEEFLQACYWKHYHQLQYKLRDNPTAKLYWNDADHILKIDFGYREEYYPDFIHEAPDCIAITGDRCPYDDLDNYYWNEYKEQWIYMEQEEDDDDEDDD